MQCSKLEERVMHHPCYSKDAHHKYARMHLPVAPGCNIQCNYCNRKFDCVNESRPGVTSSILKPKAALERFCKVKEKISALKVVGIAGPGDALGNWDATKKTLELIRAQDKDVIFCMSTNGLMLPAYAEEILALGIEHLTVTVNAIDPEIGARIYQYINYQGKTYQGIQGAEILIKNQLAGIEYMAKRGVLVKINTVMVEGVNEDHIPQVVAKVKELGAFISNIMPLIPAPGSNFEHYPQTSMKKINKMRSICEPQLHQMRHCQQCRADAIGMLGQDQSLEFLESEEPCPNTYKIAVASKTGHSIDQHFGHCQEFLIYEIDERENIKFLEKRAVPKYCEGMEECPEDQKEATISALTDCQVVLSLRIGYAAKKKLEQRNIISLEIFETIDKGLRYALAHANKKIAG